MKLVVYDLLGRKVRTLIDGLVSSGIYETEWDGTDAEGRMLHSGVYFCHISGAHGSPDSKKTLFLK
jgi:flagellar hook assembly protein FlgD